MNNKQRGTEDGEEEISRDWVIRVVSREEGKSVSCRALGLVWRCVKKQRGAFWAGKLSIQRAGLRVGNYREKEGMSHPTGWLKLFKEYLQHVW